ncbi:hypothetical protein HK100_007720, partial [Physocladia obscura]
MAPDILSQILNKLPESEHMEMSSFLGLAIVEQINELRNELNTLTEIIAEYRDETEK